MISRALSKQSNRWGDKISDYRFDTTKRTVDEMTPDDIRKNAKKKIEELRRQIKLYLQYISDCESELAFWESIIGRSE